MIEWRPLGDLAPRGVDVFIVVNWGVTGARVDIACRIERRIECRGAVSDHAEIWRYAGEPVMPWETLALPDLWAPIPEWAGKPWRPPAEPPEQDGGCILCLLDRGRPAARLCYRLGRYSSRVVYENGAVAEPAPGFTVGYGLPEGRQVLGWMPVPAVPPARIVA